MASNWVEDTFNENQSLVVSFNVSGSTAVLVLQNTGRNMLDIQRIILGRWLPNGLGQVLYLRPPGQPGPWTGPASPLEQGTGRWYYTVTGLSAGMLLEAQVEYVEVTGRSRSSQVTI